MNKKWIISGALSVVSIIVFLCVAYGTMEKQTDHMQSAQETAGELPGSKEEKPDAPSETEAASFGETEESQVVETTDEELLKALEQAANQPQRTVVSEDYSYDIAADKQTVDISQVDITVGDHLYMTQINDWYVNFDDYADKTVEIEGYYLDFGNGYTFVGRNGPSCPYCTGGFVDFEFETDEDVSDWESEKTWIRVKGILRRGKTYYSDGSETVFYYIEALDLQKMDKVGIDTVVD